MANSSALCFFLLIFVITAHSIPDGYKVAGQKIIKIKEHDKTKDITIIKHAVISSLSGDSHSATLPSNDASAHSSEDNSKEEASTSEASTSQSHISGHGTHGKTVNGGCVIPHPEPTELYTKFAKIMISHRMFVLASSTLYGEMVSLAVTGKPLSAHDTSSACIRIMTETHRKQIFAFGSKLVVSCEFNDVGTNSTCLKKDSNGKTLMDINGIFVWTDGRAHMLAILCANGKGSWALLSNTRSIDRNSREAALTVAESYGFDPTEVIDYTFTEDDCAAAVRDDLTDGNCPESDEDLETIPQSQEAAALKILKKGVYTPFSSLANVYNTGMFIRKSALKVTEDLDEVCVKDQWHSNGEIVREGFENKKQYLECDIKDFARIKCLANEEKSGSTGASYVYNKHIHPIWTDGKKYVLTFNCLSTHLKTWALYSTSNELLDHDTKMYVLSKVADYGFDPMKGRESSYEGCNN